MRKSWASSEHARLTMRANRARDTTPERAIRSVLHARGLRYRTHYRPIKEVRRTGDIVFTRLKLVVFVDGCFWHACPQHFVPPKTNATYWGPKIKGNVERDRTTDQVLRAAGWTVLRYWEHESADRVADQIEEQLNDLRAAVE